MFLDRYYMKNLGTTLYKEGFQILKDEVIDQNKDKLLESIITELNK